MNISDTLRGLLRRWYIVIPGLILTIAVAVAAWQMINPKYERVGVQLLLPGATSIPDEGNPYLYLGGLSQASDVLVTAMSSEQEVDTLIEDYPGAELVIRRDPVTSGPQILITVTAGSDADAGKILRAAVARSTVVLESLQDINGITPGNRMSLKSIAVDTQSTLVEKTRLLGVVGAALAMLLLTLLTAGLVDGLSARKRLRASGGQRISELDDSDLLPEGAALGKSPGAHRGRRARRPHSTRWRPVRRKR
jgi:hypothetical protein